MEILHGILENQQRSCQSVAQGDCGDRASAVGWIHFLVMDLFVGRWIYLEGQRTGVWTIHSLVLCLFAGPLGLLSHLLTSWINQTSGKATPTEATVSSPPPAV